MRHHPWIAVASLVFCGILGSGSALADGEILITQAKALAGGVTPGDAEGFPITLSTAGFYKLSTNLIVPAGKTGIQITSSYVTVDLNGFAMQGGGSAASGIVGSNNQGGTVRNGTITRFGSNGIYAFGNYWVVENMRVVKNGGVGIGLTSTFTNGLYQRVLNSTVADNGGDGIACGSCLVEGNAISNNGDAGFRGGSATILGNEISTNASQGIYASGTIGFGNNRLSYNNNGGSQISANVNPLQPNFCVPTAC